MSHSRHCSASIITGMHEMTDQDTDVHRAVVLRMMTCNSRPEHRSRIALVVHHTDGGPSGSPLIAAV